MKLDGLIDHEKASVFFAVEADALTWMAVQGALELALRHPENTGPSAELVR